MAQAPGRLDAFEVALICAVIAGLAWQGGRSWQRGQPAGEGMLAEQRPELDRLANAYGPSHNSHGAEEWIVRDFFHDRRDGFFLDIGAAYYQQDNNTYYLETALGWRGIAIDAQQEYAAGYAANRPHTRFFTLFVSDVADAMVDFYVPGANPLEASSIKASAGQDGHADGRRVPTTTLNALLDREHVTHVDFVSLDIELAEPRALAGFDVERFAPALLCVEVHPEVRQEILDYFHRHHYEVVGRYLPSDHMNLYFMPERMATTN